MRHQPISIKDMGLESYLNMSKADHNNFGYEEFVAMVTEEVNPSNLARAFKVSRLTMAKWLDIHREEVSHG